MSTVAVVFNPRAAGAEGRGVDGAAVERALAGHGVAARVATVVGSDLVDAAREALDEGVEALVAAGGDGTVSAVAGVLAGTGVALGVLPLGAFNHFAGDLGVPTDLDGAAAVMAEALAAGRRRRLDLAEICGRPMLNNSILGFYARAVSERGGGGGGRLAKGWRTTRAMGAVLRNPPLLDLVLVSDGRERRHRTPFLFVGNDEYTMNLFAFGARPRLSNGQLFVHLVEAGDRSELLRLLALWAVRDLRGLRRAESWTTGELRVESALPELEVFVDGELLHLRPPLVYRSRPGALEVLAPPQDGEGEGGQDAGGRGV
ncbi:MAG TPA: diacylglycerol kinase family protein [Thermoanaerobaculia bacterium]|nr:diacylglycerol kinase family protein [Thermoanaerobaculia bacterium]